MLTKRENLLETIHGGNPDRYVNQYEAFALLRANPFADTNPNPAPGQLNVVNAWGVTKSWPKGTPGVAVSFILNPAISTFLLRFKRSFSELGAISIVLAIATSVSSSENH